MAYKKDQGRYARMSAFWALFLLVGYGCLGGLVYELRSWIGAGEPLVADLPLLGDLDVPMLVTLIVLAIAGIVIYRTLERPQLADLLIATENEMRKVTWPSWPETWHGTLAVGLTVVCLLVYLYACDWVLAYVMPRAMGAG